MKAGTVEPRATRLEVFRNERRVNIWRSPFTLEQDTRSRLKLVQEFVVSRMGADPEPNHGILIKHAKRPITDPDPSRVHGRVEVYLLEMQTRMGRIPLKQLESLPRLLLNLRRKGRKQITKSS